MTKPTEGQPARESIEITKNQLLVVSFTDFLIIVVVILDLLYIGGYVQLAPGDMLAINVVSVSISFYGYQVKKRIRKINRRKAETTSQESQRSP